MTTRQPAVAGFFYPADERSLLAEVDGFMPTTDEPRSAMAAIMPHAGYVYSGATAGAVAATLNVPDKVIMLGPKHRRGGANGAVAAADTWSFPFGEIPVDAGIAKELAEIPGLELDDLAHRDEHSLEVEVPFIWRRNPRVSIAPVALGMHTPEELRRIGAGIGQVIARSAEPILLVVSTDMSHQIPIEEAKRLDHLAIDRVLDLDPEGLYETVFSNRISMCGVIPVTAALFAAKHLGAKRAKLVDYSTSADASGDTSAVVGYAGIVVE